MHSIVKQIEQERNLSYPWPELDLPPLNSFSQIQASWPSWQSPAHLFYQANKFKVDEVRVDLEPSAVWLRIEITRTCL